MSLPGGDQVDGLPHAPVGEIGTKFRESLKQFRFGICKYTPASGASRPLRRHAPNYTVIEH